MQIIFNVQLFPVNPSFPRRRESNLKLELTMSDSWIPADAEMTAGRGFTTTTLVTT